MSASAIAAVAMAFLSSTLGSAPRVEVLTMSPGEEIYTLWGHAALRIQSESPYENRVALDQVFNYGSIDFSPGALRRVLKGHVEAFLAVGRYHRMFETYARAEDRTVEGRVLDLGDVQTERLMELLGADARAHALYEYDHLRDNCSSRVADVIDQTLEGQLSRKFSREPAPKRTYRAYALDPLPRRPLAYLAADVLLSGVADRPISKWDARFSPAGLASILDEAVADGHPLVTERRPIYQSKEVFRPDESHAWPWLWGYLFFTLPLVALALFFPRLVAVFFGLTTGFVGLALLVFQFGSSYDFLHGNWNIIAFAPTNLLLILVLAQRLRGPIAFYLGASAAAMLLAATASALHLIDQQILAPTAALWPIVFVLAIRFAKRRSLKSGQRFDSPVSNIQAASLD